MFALGAALFHSVSTILGKRELIKEHSTEFLTIHVFFIGLLSLLIIPFVNFGISLYTLIFLILIAIIFLEASIFSTKALKHMEISVVVPLTNLSPLFLLLLAYIFLGEKLAGIQFVGILFLIFGAYMIESDHKAKNVILPFKKILKSKYFHYVVISMILFSIISIAEKYLLDEGLIDPISMLFYLAIFGSVTVLFFQLFFFRNYKGVKRAFKISRGPIFISAVAFLLTAAFHYMAISLMLVSIVIPIKRLSTLISTIIGGEFFHEKYILYKSIACVIMLLGVFMIVYPMT